MFVQNLRSRDIEAQVHGHRRPLYEGHLLDRNVHIADFDVPADSTWAGASLMELGLGHKYGVQVSSILRAGRRYNIPEGDAVIFPGDRLQVIGSDDQLATFGKALPLTGTISRYGYNFQYFTCFIFNFINRIFHLDYFIL